MTKEKIQDTLKGILDVLGHSNADFSKPFRDNDIDSLDVVELIIECERKFNVSVSDLEIAECKTLNQIVELVQSKLPD